MWKLLALSLFANSLGSIQDCSNGLSTLKLTSLSLEPVLPIVNEPVIMTVQFNNGYTYEYYGITAELWNSFIAAQPNPWSQVGYPRLVQAGVPYKRIS